MIPLGIFYIFNSLSILLFKVVLCNPICAVTYAHVTYNFFDDRIHEEERYLLEFFGQQYVDYQQRVGVGIPGIKGFISP